MSMTLLAAAAVLTSVELTAPGPNGRLAGTLVEAGKGAPVVLIVPGSGPTDREGNSPLGVTAAPYRLLAEGLAGKGVTSVRIDKRGMFGSRGAIPDPNAVLIRDYAADVHSWVNVIRAKTGVPCVWLLGHSEGSLVALAAAQRSENICGVISVSGSGRPLGETMRAQFRANPANAAILGSALKMLDELEAGRRVDPATLPAPLAQMVPAAVQGYMIDLLGHKPAALARSLKVPLLVVQGETDLQTGVEDAQLLASASPGAPLAILPGVNHVLKSAPIERSANLATYADPSLPIAPAVVDTVAGFIKR